MATIWIPALLRPFADDNETLKVEGTTLAELITELDQKFPGIKARLVEGNTLRPGMSVVIDGQVSRAGLQASVEENSEVHFIPAIGGGASPLV